MRMFYDKIKKRKKALVDPVFVIWDSNSPTESPIFSSTKAEFLEYWAEYMEKTFDKSSIHNFTNRNL